VKGTGGCAVVHARNALANDIELHKSLFLRHSLLQTEFFCDVGGVGD
jgi:hypothetical protein